MTTVFDVAINEALSHPQLFGAALGSTETWTTWLTVLRAAAGLPLNDQQRERFITVAGGRTPPSNRVRELWAVVGRGGGKSWMAAACAVHTALLQHHQLAPGEVGHVLVLSPTVAQAKVVFGYCMGFIEQSPVLHQELVGVTASEIRLHNGIIIGTHPNSFRSVRGRSLLAVIFDEVSFWRDETSALPDVEAYRAVLPSLIRTGGQLIGISTPYRKFGLLFQKHKDHFGIASDDVLVVQGSSTQFNPMLSEGDIARAMRDDPEAGLSEWQGEFRADIGAFLDDRDIDGCVDHDRPIELRPRPSNKYHAFCDPSGGRHDAFAIAIGHREGELTIIDALRGHHPPFDTKLVVNECATLCKEYGVREVVGDNYAAAWVETEFKAAGIRYLRSELPKGRLYVENLPAFTRRVVSLPDHPKLLRELRLLERRVHVGGKDTVDHGRVGSDDFANAVFGVLQCAQKPKQRIRCITQAHRSQDGTWVPSIEIDPATGRPIKPDRTRIRIVRLTEQEAPAVRGLVHGKLGS